MSGRGDLSQKRPSVSIDKLTIEVLSAEVVDIPGTDTKTIQYRLRLAIYPESNNENCLQFVRKQRFSILRALHSELWYHAKLVFGIELPKFPSRHRLETIIGVKNLVPRREEELRRYYEALCLTLGSKLLEFSSFREFFDIDGEYTAKFRAKSILRTTPKKIKSPQFAMRKPLKHRQNQNIRAAGVHRSSKLSSSGVVTNRALPNLNSRNISFDEFSMLYPPPSDAAPPPPPTKSRAVTTNQKKFTQPIPLGGSDPTQSLPVPDGEPSSSWISPVEMTPLSRKRSSSMGQIPDHSHSQTKQIQPEEIVISSHAVQVSPLRYRQIQVERIPSTSNPPQHFRKLKLQSDLAQIVQQRKESQLSALVIDFGSSKIRFKRTDVNLALTLPSVIGKPKPNLQHVNPGLYQYDQYFGDDVFSFFNAASMNLIHPREQGRFLNIPATYSLLEHCVFLHNDNPLIENSPDVLVICADLLSPNEIRTLCSWIQEDWTHRHTLGFSHFFLCSQQVLALAAKDKTIGVVVHLGHQQSSVSVIYENFILPGTKKFPVCGKLLTEHIISTMEARDVYYYLFDGSNRVSERHKEAAAVEFKEHFCYCEHFAAGEDKIPEHLKHFVGLMEDQRTSIAMSAFQPANIGLDCKSLQQLIVETILLADEALHEMLFSSIVVCGGSSNFPGFIDCLTNYVRQEMRQYHVSHKLTIHHASESDFVLNGASRFMANKPDKNFLVHCLSSNMETLEGLVVEDPCSFFF